MQNAAPSDEYSAWHLDKRINISHMVATIVLAGGAIGAWSAQNERIARLEARLEAREAAAITESTEIRVTLSDLRTEVGQVRDLLIQQIQRREQSNRGSY